MKRAPELVAALSETLAVPDALASQLPAAHVGLQIHCRFCGKRTRAGDEAMLQARFERHLRNCNAAKKEAGEP